MGSVFPERCYIKVRSPVSQQISYCKTDLIEQRLLWLQLELTACIPIGANDEQRIRTACAGLQAQTKALDLIANNLANLSTTGYRAQQPLFRSSLEVANREEMDPLNRAVNDFDVLAGSQVDLRAGNMVRTGNSLDLAIEGTGFFAVQTKAGTTYTEWKFSGVPRRPPGNWRGRFVLGDQGPASVPAGTISISPDGVLSVDGAVSARLRISDLDPGAVPGPVGKQYSSIPAQSVRPAAESYVSARHAGSRPTLARCPQSST